MSQHIDKARKVFNLEQWSDGYFDINDQGQLGFVAKEQFFILDTIVKKAQSIGASLPLLLRFRPILIDRLEKIRKSFQHVSHQLGYCGDYLPVYPIKVNQQVDVLETIANYSHVGLEVGSKPELLVVLAHAKPGQLIICNGYKDRQFIELAGLACELGHEIYVVIEKPSEAQIIHQLQVQGKPLPKLGVRVRLSQVGSSHWQNSGGHRSKFGLNAIEICQLVKDLQQWNLLDKLTLLHFHIGSQIANIRDIRSSMQEASQWYCRLRDLNVPLSTIDVGGGLAIDYLGTANRHEFSKNYDFDGYAKAILQPLRDLCREHSQPMPRLLSESGRALTAHHAVFITNILSRESQRVGEGIVCEPHCLLQEFEEVVTQIGSDNVVESYHEGHSVAQELSNYFIVGQLSLAQKARSLELSHQLFNSVREHLSYGQRQHRDILDEINQLDVQKVLCNMSVFQMLPDAWAIGQVFPVMPLGYLNQPLTQRTVLHDLTCDSDGQVKTYALEDGVESSMLLPKMTQEQLTQTPLAFFLVGAYQETLGDIHNLFGHQDSIMIDIDKQGNIQLMKLAPGQSTTDVIEMVGYQKQDLLLKIQEKIMKIPHQPSITLESIKKMFDQNTYLQSKDFNEN